MVFVLPGLMSECSEVASHLNALNVLVCPTFIPRQILVKGVLQYVGSLVSFPSSPVIPLWISCGSWFNHKELSNVNVCCGIKGERSQVQTEHSPNLTKEKRMIEVVRIGSTINPYLNKLRKAMFSILCDVIFLVRLQGKFEIDHSWE